MAGCMARRGAARRGEARHGRAQGRVHGVAGLGSAGRGRVHGKARRGEAWHGLARQGEVRGSARLGAAGLGSAGRGRENHMIHEVTCPICIGEFGAVHAADQVCVEHETWYLGPCWCCSGLRFAENAGDLCQTCRTTLYGELTDTGPPTV